jgi:hypothetical protein
MERRAAGELKLPGVVSGETQYVNLSIDSLVVASIEFQLDYLREDISKVIVIEEDDVILKKDDTEFLRQ